MEDIQEKTDTINLDTPSNNNENNANDEINKNVPRTLPDLPDLTTTDNNIKDNKDNESNNSPNFVTNSEDKNEKPNLELNNNEDNDKNTDTTENEEQGSGLINIVPGSVGNKIRHFEVIQEEKKKEKLVPQKLNRKAFRSRVNSSQAYKRESLALLSQNPETNLRIQTVISQLFNSQNDSNIPNNNVTTPTSKPGNRISSYRNQLSNNEMTMEAFLKKIRENNGEIDDEPPVENKIENKIIKEKNENEYKVKRNNIKGKNIKNDIENSIENNKKDNIENTVENNSRIDSENVIENKNENEIEKNNENEIEDTIENNNENEIENNVENTIGNNNEVEIEKNNEIEIENNEKGNIENTIENDNGNDIENNIENSSENDVKSNNVIENINENNKEHINEINNENINENSNENVKFENNDNSNNSIKSVKNINRYSHINVKPNRFSDISPVYNRNVELPESYNKRFTARSQDSPLRFTAYVNETDIEEQRKTKEILSNNDYENDVDDNNGSHGLIDGSKSNDSLPDHKPLVMYHFQSQQNIVHNELSNIKHTLSYSSNELVNSETDDSLNKIDDIDNAEPILRKQHNTVSDTQLTASGIIKFKTQFIKISSKKNSRANIKSIHIKGNSNSNSQENIKNSWESLSRVGSVSDDSLTSLNNISSKKNSIDQMTKAIEIHPLKINTKMTSDTNLYGIHNEFILSSKSSKSFIAIPTSISKKSIKPVNKVEMRHITKKSSISTVSSDDSVASPMSVTSDKDKVQSQSPHNERRYSRMNEYNTDILYEYFDEESGEEENLINSESASAQNVNIDPNKAKLNNLSIKTNVRQKSSISGSDVVTSNITPLDQVYNTISQELEQRLCQTVRHSILQRVDSSNFMIPINILYEKHYKTQVIYVERRMTIEEVLQQALNSINIYEDYGNYELLQIFGFEDIIEEEEGNENNKNEEENKANENKDKEPSSPTDSSTKYQNVLDPDDKIQDVLEQTMSRNNSKRKTNNLLTFRIRKKCSTMKISIYLEEEKRYYTVLVTKTTTSADVIEALLFIQNEPYVENGWYIQRKNLDNFEAGKELLEPTDTLYNKDENFKYVLKRKRSKQMSKLANILGVTDENDLLIDTKEPKKKKDKNKGSNELIKTEPLKDSDDYCEYSEEKIEAFTRILNLSKEELYSIYMRNKKLSEKKKIEMKKKCGSADQLSMNSNTGNLKDSERFSSQVFNIFKSKKEKRLSKIRDTGSMPLLNDTKEYQPKDPEESSIPVYNNSTEFVPSNNDIHTPGKRAKKLGNFFGVKPSQRENTELNNIIRKNYNSKKALDSSQQYVVIRVYFANLTYTTINMSINDTCKTAKRILCERLGVKESDEGLYQIYEFTQKNGYERELHNSERPFDTMRRWQKDEIFLFKLKNTNAKIKSGSRTNIHDKNMTKYDSTYKSQTILYESNTNLAETDEQPVKRMAKLAGFFGVMNSKQEEKNNIESEEEVKELFNMLHVMSNSKEEATKQIINFIHSKDVIIIIM